MVHCSIITWYINAVTEAEYKSEFEYTKDIPYLALTPKLLGVFCEDIGENWPNYNDIIF